MISRYTLLLIVTMILVAGCVTPTQDKSSDENDYSTKSDLDIRVGELIEKYNREPELLLNKVLEIVDENNREYNSLFSKLYFAAGDYQKAREFILADEHYSEKPDKLKELIVIEKALGGNYIEVADRLLEIDGNNVFALNMKADFFLLNEELDTADKLLTQSFYIDPKDSRTLTLLGDLALKRVDSLNLAKKKVLSQQEETLVKSYYNLALDYYSRITESYNPLYYVKLSNVYKKLGMKLDAVKSISKAIELDPDDIWNYYDRGKLYFYMGENHLALPDFEMAFSLNSNHFFTNVFLGRVHFAMNDVESSYFHYKKALKINPSYDPAYKDLSVLTYIQGNIEESLNYQISLYKRESRRDPFIPLYLVNTLLDLNRKKDARKILQNLVKYEKNSTMKGIYNYYLDPEKTGDEVLSDALNQDDTYFRIRLSYYVACALDRGGIHALSESIMQDVADANVDFESKLASYKLGEMYE